MKRGFILVAAWFLILCCPAFSKEIASADIDIGLKSTPYRNAILKQTLMSETTAFPLSPEDPACFGIAGHWLFGMEWNGMAVFIPMTCSSQAN